MTGDRLFFGWILYDMKIQRRLDLLVSQHSNIRRCRSLADVGAYRDALEDLLYDACEKGRINQQELYEARDSRTNVFQGQSRADGADVYAVARVDVTATDARINRIADQADIMRNATEKEVIPLMVYAHIGDASPELAWERGVALIHVRFEDVKLIDTSLINT